MCYNYNVRGENTMSDKLSKKIKSDLYYDYLIKDIINNENYLMIKDIPHHGATDRYSHCLKVSYRAYKLAKFFNADEKVAARSGLLHDFYYEIPLECEKANERMKLMAKEHPNIAVYNSKKNFDINHLEEDAIKSHMYPLNLTVPKYKESWLVSLADKAVSIVEVSHRFKYSLNILTLFLMNWLLR